MAAATGPPALRTCTLELCLPRRQAGQDDGAGTARRDEEAPAAGSLDLALGAKELQADGGRRA